VENHSHRVNVHFWGGNLLAWRFAFRRVERRFR
jgi:hypothetical protein